MAANVKKDIGSSENKVTINPKTTTKPIISAHTNQNTVTNGVSRVKPIVNKRRGFNEDIRPRRGKN